MNTKNYSKTQILVECALLIAAAKYGMDNLPRKVKLRAAIKYFNGDMNNIPVQIVDEDKTLPCGAIYCTEEILKVFQEILGEKKVEIKEI